MYGLRPHRAGRVDHEGEAGRDDVDAVEGDPRSVLRLALCARGGLGGALLGRRRHVAIPLGCPELGPHARIEAVVAARQRLERAPQITAGPALLEAQPRDQGVDGGELTTGGDLSDRGGAHDPVLVLDEPVKGVAAALSGLVLEGERRRLTGDRVLRPRQRERIGAREPRAHPHEQRRAANGRVLRAGQPLHEPHVRGPSPLRHGVQRVVLQDRIAARGGLREHAIGARVHHCSGPCAVPAHGREDEPNAPERAALPAHDLGERCEGVLGLEAGEHVEHDLAPPGTGHRDGAEDHVEALARAVTAEPVERPAQGTRARLVVGGVPRDLDHGVEAGRSEAREGRGRNPGLGAVTPARRLDHQAEGLGSELGIGRHVTQCAVDPALRGRPVEVAERVLQGDVGRPCLHAPQLLEDLPGGLVLRLVDLTRERPDASVVLEVRGSLAAGGSEEGEDGDADEEADHREGAAARPHAP